MDGRYMTAMGLIGIGIAIVVIGVLFLVGDKIPFVGKLPGDIHVSGKGWSFHFPIVTCIVLSVIATVILNLIFRR